MPISPSTVDPHTPSHNHPSSDQPSSPPTHHDSLLEELHHSDQRPGADNRNARAKRSKGRGQVVRLDWGAPQETGRRGGWDGGGELDQESDDQDDEDEEGSEATEQSSPLLALPSDPLLDILSFLPPSSLLNVLLVCKHLNNVASDEVAWRSLFEFNFLSGDINAAGIMRSCQVAGGAGRGWRKEAVSRERFLYRMSHSRSPSLLHDPRLAQIHSFALSYPLPPPGTPAHQIRGPSLLSASLVYGICSRSDPATGKVVKGYVDSLGSTDQQALFNPNHLFSPVTSILLAPLDPSLVLWGFQDGHVQLTNLVVGGGRTPSRSLRSAPADSHEGAVWCLAGGAGGFLSGGEDGRVKLWMGGAGEKRDERMKLLWTGERRKEEEGADPRVKQKGIAIVKVCWDPTSGTAVGVTEGGEVRVWTGLGAEGDAAAASRSAKTHATWRDDSVEAGSPQQAFGVALALDVVPSIRNEPPIVNVLVHLVGRPSFFRISFDFSSSSGEPAITTTTFGPASASFSTADITIIHPEFTVPPSPSLPLSSAIPTPSILSPSVTPPPSAPNVFHLPTPSTVEERIKTRGALGQSKFVVAGDSDGWVRVWDWDASSSEGGVVEPVREWRGGDTKITALSCSSGLVLAGTISGILNVFDPLTLLPTLLRSFSERAASRHSVRNLAAGALDPDLFRVSQVVLDRDLIVASVGSKILSWRIGKSGSNVGNSPWSGKVLGRRAAGGGSGGGGAGKGRGGPSHHEIHSEIVQAQKAHQAQQRATQDALERDRAKVDRFTGDLDLTEEERLAYVLMLSRDEEERRSSSRGPRNSPASRQRSSSSTASGRNEAPHAPEDEDDEQLRLALEASLLDEDPSFERAEDQEEELEDEYLQDDDDDDDDDDYYEHSNASSYTPDSPLRQPSSSSAYFSPQPHPHPRYSRLSPLSSPVLAATRRRPSGTPSPTFGSLEDQTSWPAMGGGTPVGKGKKVATKVDATGPPPKMDWSKLAVASASTSTTSSPSGARTAASDGPAASASVPVLTREQQEEEELRLVLEMSLLDS